MMNVGSGSRRGWVAGTVIVFTAVTGFGRAEPAPEEFSISMVSEQSIDPAPFSKGSRFMEVDWLRGFGMTDFGGQENHDLILLESRFGYTVTEIVAPERFIGGSIEMTAQVFTGVQEQPKSAFLMGLNPGLRYHFHTGIRWVPYVGFNAGILFTDIGTPDLGGKFQFNEQLGAGFHWFASEHVAFNVEYRLTHISNAHLRTPNRGVNDQMIVLGLGWFF